MAPRPRKHAPDPIPSGPIRAREIALARLGIEPSRMATEPKVTPVLKSAEGGLEAVIDAIRFSSEPDCITFISAYDKVSDLDRPSLTLEEIAVSAGIGARRLLEIASSALFDFSDTEAKVMLASSRPKLIRKSMEVAMTSKGFSDRDLMSRASGIIAPAKGATISIAPTFANAVNNVSAEIPTFKRPEDRLKEIHSITDDAPMLGDGITIDAEIVPSGKRKEVADLVGL